RKNAIMRPPLIMQFIAAFNNDKNTIQLPAFYYTQWAPNYPEMVHLRYNGAIYESGKLAAGRGIHPGSTYGLFNLLRKCWIILNPWYYEKIWDIIIRRQEDWEDVTVFEIDDVKAWKSVLISVTSYALGLFLISKAPCLLPLAWAWTGTIISRTLPTLFHTQNGVTFWDCASREPKLNHLFNDAMTNDSRLISSVVIEKCKGVFNGLESLVDVGGGTGTIAKAIAKSFPHLKCIVFDLPRVVDGLQGTEDIEYVQGDMFEAIPSFDSIMLKTIMHNWNDEECLKILKICKEAIASKDKENVIIIDVVIGNEKGDSELDHTKLFYDMEMMVLAIGKERNEKDKAKLFFSAGFN
ncbi:putative O-methyltransferase 3, partial [Glycine soja]